MTYAKQCIAMQCDAMQCDAMQYTTRVNAQPFLTCCDRNESNTSYIYIYICVFVCSGGITLVASTKVRHKQSTLRLSF